MAKISDSDLPKCPETIDMLRRESKRLGLDFLGYLTWRINRSTFLSLPRSWIEYPGWSWRWGKNYSSSEYNFRVLPLSKVEINPPLCPCGCGRVLKRKVGGGYLKYGLDSKCRNRGYRRLHADKVRGSQRAYESKRRASLVAKKLEMELLPDVPLCACGCGKRVGWDPHRRSYSRYSRGHTSSTVNVNAYVPVAERGEAPVCGCGCGGLVVWCEQRQAWNTYIRHHHRRLRPFRRKLCACGCGELIPHQNRLYASRSHQRRHTIAKRGEAPLCACGCGESVSWGKHGGGPGSPAGWREYKQGHHPAVCGKEHKRLSESEIGEFLPSAQWDSFGEEVLGRHSTDPPLCACGCGERVTKKSHHALGGWQKYKNRKHQHSDPKYLAFMSQVMKARYSEPEYLKKLAEASCVTPNRFESLFDEMTGDSIEFVGDGKLWVEFKNGRSKNPDFVVRGTSKVIELHGDYWHAGENTEELVSLYREVGYDCLVIWESEMSDRESVLRRVSEFTG